MKVFLGTAQFGLDYGLTNPRGKISKNQVFELLDFSQENGIDSLDTAYAYGESEKILGEYGVSGFKISTKLPSLKNEKNINKKNIKSIFYESLNRLNVDKVDNLFLHNSLDLESINKEYLMDALYEIKNEGLANNIGVSIYDPEDIIFLSKIDILDIIQSPLNVFDRRILQEKYRSLMTSKNIKLQARSIYLQGLLLQHPSNLSRYFLKYKNIFLDWEEYVKQKQVSKLEACVSYLRSVEDLHSFVVGITSIIEFKELIAALVSEAAQISFNPTVTSDLIDPRKWHPHEGK